MQHKRSVKFDLTTLLRRRRDPRRIRHRLGDLIASIFKDARLDSHNRDEELLTRCSAGAHRCNDTVRRIAASNALLKPSNF